MAQVRHQLSPGHFTTTPSQKAWEVLCARFDLGQEITTQALCEELERRQVTDPWGWTASLLDPSPVLQVDSVEPIADVLEERRLRRKIHDAGKRLMKHAMNSEQDIREVLYLARGYLDGLDSRANGPLCPDLAEEAARIRERLKNPPTERRAALLTGLPSLDRSVLIYAGQWVVVEGRRSEGKSSLASQIALFNASLGRRGVIFSLEMARWEYVMRLVAQRSGLRGDLLVRHYMGDTPMAPPLAEMADEEVDAIGKLPLIIEDAGPFTPDAILGRASRLHAFAPLDFVIIDHLGFVSYDGGGRDNNLRLAMKSFSNRCKRWAIDHKVAVFGLAQMTDTEPGVVPKRPMSGQVRDCRDLEDDADVVLAAHRPGRHDNGEDDRMEIGVLKQRMGWTGYQTFAWDGATYRIKDPLARQAETALYLAMKGEEKWNEPRNR